MIDCNKKLTRIKRDEKYVSRHSKFIKIKIIKTCICKLNNSQLSEITQTVTRSIFVNYDRDVLHGFRTKPFCHFLGKFLLLLRLLILFVFFYKYNASVFSRAWQNYFFEKILQQCLGPFVEPLCIWQKETS